MQLGGYEIFAHEASRPDARADDAGAAEGGACSRPGVLPWVNLTRAEAEAACAASGFHLCTDAEWQDACGGAERHWAFPYSAEHIPGRCNDHVSGTGALQPTGAEADCRTPEGVFDLSGNVWEMTADGSRRGASWRVNAVMFRTEAARCDVFYVNAEAFYADDLGFRCCRSL
ncbi:MAG: SUMF1/EgtB/PvdO family nonheme iron enzyme [Myxococcales bacterium]|nr:SUMF1/EgtB/PvdO family nonheme iron enzyme [Myxococcales bacterium]